MTLAQNLATVNEEHRTEFTLNSTQLLYTGQGAKGSMDTPHSLEIKHAEKRIGGGLGICTNYFKFD